jgi:hypothetical protein
MNWCKAMKLKKLATVQTGYSFRGRLEGSAADGIAVIQMKDLHGCNIITGNQMVKVAMKIPGTHQLVRKGDLVFRSRGQNNSAALLKDDLDRAIVAAPLLRIRITRPEILLPEYLNWYISQQDAQSYFKSRLEGTHGGIISKQTLEELEVLLPPLEKQKIIAEVSALSDHEQELVRTLAAKKKTLITTILMKSATTK